MNVGSVVMLAGEADRAATLKLIGQHLRPEQDLRWCDRSDRPASESAEEVRDRVLEAADILPVDRLGTTDDCGFSPFADDTSTSRDVAFDKIGARRRDTTRLGTAGSLTPRPPRSGDRPY